jgi:hypothetical protein
VVGATLYWVEEHAPLLDEGSQELRLRQ